MIILDGIEIFDIKDVENIAGIEAVNEVEKIAMECAVAWDWPIKNALDYVLIFISRRINEKSKLAIDTDAETR